MGTSQKEKAPRRQADAFSAIAEIEDALLSAAIDVTRQLHRRWPPGKAPVAYHTRAAYRELSRRKRLFDEALAAADRLRNQLATATPPHGIVTGPSQAQPRTNGGTHHDAAISASF